MNQKPILHISIDYQGNSQIKKELNEKLHNFSKILYKDPFNPIMNIRFDAQDMQMENQILISHHRGRFYVLILSSCPNC